MNKIWQSKKFVVIAIISVLVIMEIGALALIAVKFLPSFLSSVEVAGGGERIVLATLDRDGEGDLFLMNMGETEKEAVILAENAKAAPVLFLIPQKDGEMKWVGDFRLGGSYGGFVPDSKFLLYWYNEADKIFVNTIPVNGSEPVSIFDSKSAFLVGEVFGDSGNIFLSASSNEKARCYISQSNEEAERVGKGSDCIISRDGTKVFISDSESDEMTLTATDINGGNEVDLLDKEKGVLSTDISFDGSRIAYLQSSKDGQKVLILDTSNGDVIAESDEYFSIAAYGFPPHGNAFYFIAEDKNELQLFTMSEGGASKIAAGFTINASFSLSGEYLVYLVGDEDGEQTLYVHPMAGGKDVKVLAGDGLEYELLTAPERILIKQQADEDLTISSAGINGDQIVQLYDEFGMSLTAGYHIPGEKQLYLLVNSKDGMSLFVTPIDQEGGVLAFDEWAELTLLNRAPGGQQIILEGREDSDDDPALFLHKVEEKAKPVELDDDVEGLVNAVFAPNGTDIVYTAMTGSDADEVEVRLAQADGKEKYKVIYEESYLVDTQWDKLSPFSAPLSWKSTISGTSYCLGAPSLSIGDEAKDKLKTAETQDKAPQNCYRTQLEADQLYTIKVDSEDTRLKLYNRSGDLISEDDPSGSSTGSLLQMTVDASGTYFIVIEASDSQSSSSEYTLSIDQGYGDPNLDNAPQLPPDSRVKGAIKSSSKLGDSFYGTFYYFDGKKDERVTIDIFAQSIGSNLDPIVHLFNPLLPSTSNYDDDGGDGSDSKLTYTLPEDGRYFVLVTALDSSNYGTSSDYYYEILLTVK